LRLPVFVAWSDFEAETDLPVDFEDDAEAGGAAIAQARIKARM
jgi:hypothetical protein